VRAARRPADVFETRGGLPRPTEAQKGRSQVPWDASKLESESFFSSASRNASSPAGFARQTAFDAFAADWDDPPRPGRHMLVALFATHTVSRYGDFLAATPSTIRTNGKAGCAPSSAAAVQKKREGHHGVRAACQEDRGKADTPEGLSGLS